MVVNIDSILDNLVYGVFGEPIYFGIIISIIFIYYSIKYDIPKWGFIAFFIPLMIWISFYYLPSWIVILILILSGFIIGPRLLRFTNA